MPSVLHLKAIPRCTVWAKMFNDRGPDSDDIGLYLLPFGVRSDRCYSSLVSHIEKQDIVLQNCIQGAQLLIFSSSHLDEKSQKIKQAYYLWGLFVAPNITFKRPELKQHAPENEQTVDMEIDMLGGAPVGTIDVHIPRNLPLSSSKKSEDAVAATQPVPHTQVKLEQCEVDGLGSPPGFPARTAWVEPGAPPGFEDMLGRAPIGQIDVPIPGDSPLISSKKSINAAAGSQSAPQVKPEKWDGLGSPPGFPAQTAWVEPRVPPGFEETGRLKYKTMNEIYSSNLEIEDEAN